MPPNSFALKRRGGGEGTAADDDEQLIPYGLNRLLPRTARSKDTAPEQRDMERMEEEGQEGVVMGQRMLATDSRRFSPPAIQQVRRANHLLFTVAFTS